MYFRYVKRIILTMMFDHMFIISNIVLYPRCMNSKTAALHNKQ